MKRYVAPIALAAVVGAAVLVAVPASGGPFRSVEPTPTMTEEELSAYSDRRNQDDLSENLAVARRLIQSGESVAKLPRSETEGWRYQQPLALDEALSTSDHLLVGVVQDQILTGSDTDPLAIFLVSIIAGDDGTEVGRFVQRTAVVRPAGGGIALSYAGSGGQLLSQGYRYALPCTGTADSCQAIWRHLYAVGDKDMVSPLAEFEGRERIAGVPVTELVARWEELRARSQ